MSMEIDIGIPTEQRTAIAEGLSRLLADTYTLYLKTHNYHWNVTGPMFQTLHTMFMTQYTELSLAVDDVAERIRALGHPAPGSYAAFARLSSIAEEETVPASRDMIANLVKGHEAVTRTARRGLPGRRSGQRRAHLRSADATDAGVREDGLDAAQPARPGMTALPLGRRQLRP